MASYENNGHCPECGFRLTPPGNFCTDCGKKITDKSYGELKLEFDREMDVGM